MTRSTNGLHGGGTEREHIGLTDTQTTDSEAAYETLPQAIFQFLPKLIPD